MLVAQWSLAALHRLLASRTTCLTSQPRRSRAPLLILPAQCVTRATDLAKWPRWPSSKSKPSRLRWRLLVRVASQSKSWWALPANCLASSAVIKRPQTLATRLKFKKLIWIKRRSITRPSLPPRWQPRLLITALLSMFQAVLIWACLRKIQTAQLALSKCQNASKCSHLSTRCTIRWVQWKLQKIQLQKYSKMTIKR